MSALSVDIRETGIDAEVGGPPQDAGIVTLAWVTTNPSRGVSLSAFAGALASNPSAAVVGARSEGRRGGFVECLVSELRAEFAPLRESPIGAVVPLRAQEPAIGIVIDRIAAAFQLDDSE